MHQALKQTLALLLCSALISSPALANVPPTFPLQPQRSLPIYEGPIEPQTFEAKKFTSLSSTHRFLIVAEIQSHKIKKYAVFPIDNYEYDAFGTLLGHPSPTLTSYLFTGEQFDADLGMYFMRARYLETCRGRFWTVDSYTGNNYDPVSLHKYVYAGQEPTSRIDPSGNDYSLEELTASLSISSILDAIVVNACRSVLGALSGAVMGGVDAKLGGGNFFDGAKAGAWQGAILGPLLFWSKIAPAIKIVAALFVGYGASKSFMEGQALQGMFRAFLGFILIAPELPKLPWGGIGSNRNVDPNLLVPNPNDDFFKPGYGPSQTGLQKYANEVKSTGKISVPIEVQDLGNGTYGILNGHHRWTVALRFGLRSVPIHINK